MLKQLNPIDCVGHQATYVTVRDNRFLIVFDHGYIAYAVKDDFVINRDLLFALKTDELCIDFGKEVIDSGIMTPEEYQHIMDEIERAEKYRMEEREIREYRRLKAKYEWHD
jgi:hypothetical protein